MVCMRVGPRTRKRFTASGQRWTSRAERRRSASLSVVTTVRRKAPPRTARALEEDLRQIREEGGALQASDAAFTALTEWPLPVEDGFERREAVQSFVLTQLRMEMAEVVAKPTAESCDQAAAATLLTIFGRSADDKELIASTRRRARGQHQCQLTIDGMRKREDKLLRRAAARMRDEIERRISEQGPQSIEERVLLAHDNLLNAYGVITDSLRRLYRHAPASDAPDREVIVLNMLYEVAWTQWWAAPIVEMQTSGKAMTPEGVIYADVAGRLAVRPFVFSGDKAAVRRILTSDDVRDRAGFKQRLGADADGVGIVKRFTQWASQCHETCAFLRTLDNRLYCDPHDFAFGLWLVLVHWRQSRLADPSDFVSTEFGVFPEIEA